MIDIEFIENLIRAIDESGLDSIEIERGGTRIRLSRTPPAAAASAQVPVPAVPEPAAAGPAPGEPAAAAESAQSRADLLDVPSPMVGTFYRSPAPDAPSYVNVGDRVKNGDTLCIIEAMKLMNELESEVEGTIAEILVENAEPVEYGQVLFRVKP